MSKSEFELFDELPWGVQLISNQLEYRFLNKALYQQVQKGPTEMIGKKITDVFPGFEETDIYKKIVECRDLQESQSITNEFVFPDGRRTFHELKMEPVEQGVLIFSVDITDSKQGEVLLQESNQKLEKRVQQRTEEIQNLSKQLDAERIKSIHKEKLASIGELAAGVGHEINNPLTIVGANLMSIKKKLKKGQVLGLDDLVAYIDKMETALSRIGVIVKGLRNFSRSESTEDFDPISCLTESVEMLQGIYMNEGVSLSMEETDGFVGVSVHGSRGKLQQVFMNFLSNARDAVSTQKKKQIKISFSQQGDQLKICFDDSGVGIPKEVQDRIFDPFFTTKSVGKGTGLGLSLAHKYLAELDGKIDIEQSDLGGARIVLFLPTASGVAEKKSA
jgi:C4-dicarboxylate-specific signal transduction histidine kinase